MYWPLSFDDNYIPFCILKVNHEIVQQGFYELRIDLADFNNVQKHALYNRFYIGDEKLTCTRLRRNGRKLSFRIFNTKCTEVHLYLNYCNIVDVFYDM